MWIPFTSISSFIKIQLYSNGRQLSDFQKYQHCTRRTLLSSKIWFSCLHLTTAQNILCCLIQSYYFIHVCVQKQTKQRVVFKWYFLSLRVILMCIYTPIDIFLKSLHFLYLCLPQPTSYLALDWNQSKVYFK